MGQYLFPASTTVSGFAEKRQRIIYAAISGFIAGTICILVASFINVWLFPELPLKIDWQRIFVLWLAWAFIAGALAGVAAISSEGWGSILLSAFLMAAVILIINFVQGIDSIMLNILVLLGLALPFTAVMVPVAFIFFWLAKRFLHLYDYVGWERWKIILLNGLVIILLGVLPGLYSKFNLRANEGTHLIHNMLQDTALSSELPTPLENAEGFAEHRTQPYTLSQVPSVYSTVGIDVTAHYEDGYALRCTAILYPERNSYVSPCKGLLP